MAKIEEKNQLVINDTVISMVKKTKFLGVYTVILMKISCLRTISYMWKVRYQGRLVSYTNLGNILIQRLYWCFTIRLYILILHIACLFGEILVNHICHQLYLYRIEQSDWYQELRRVMICLFFMKNISFWISLKYIYTQYNVLCSSTIIINCLIYLTNFLFEIQIFMIETQNLDRYFMSLYVTVKLAVFQYMSLVSNVIIIFMIS